MSKTPTLLALKRATLKLNNGIKKEIKTGTAHKFTHAEVKEIWIKYGGRCVYCGTPLRMQGSDGFNALNYQLYNPPKFGGGYSVRNLVTVCAEHTVYSKTSKSLREEIPDIDTIADVIEQLILGIVVVNKHMDNESPDLAASIKKVQRIKRLLNMKLEDLALNMRYTPFKDWAPEYYEIIEEDINSFPDLIEQSTKDIVDERDGAVLYTNKDKIAQQVRQIISTRKYQIIRKQE